MHCAVVNDVQGKPSVIKGVTKSIRDGIKSNFEFKCPPTAVGLSFSTRQYVLVSVSCRC